MKISADVTVNNGVFYTISVAIDKYEIITYNVNAADEHDAKKQAYERFWIDVLRSTPIDSDG